MAGAETGVRLGLRLGLGGSRGWEHWLGLGLCSKVG